MSIRITQVDAFADRPFTGNPAAVCLLRNARSPEWMHAVAEEMNLPATAFLVRRDDGFDLRWFTAVAELVLCGHATLASAHVLWECGELGADEQARFHTRSGLLTADRRDGWIELDFPIRQEEPISAPRELIASLGVEPRYVGKNELDYLVELPDEAAVRGLRPDFARLAQVTMRGLIATARASAPTYDFVSRFFAPRVGIDEDPATGSAHCCLGPFWSRRLGKEDLLAYQASRRGAALRVRVAGDRVILGGQALTVLRGELSDDIARSGLGGSPS
jgi:PhzF family phenazine biosynthesis protein